MKRWHSWFFSGVPDIMVSHTGSPIRGIVYRLQIVVLENKTKQLRRLKKKTNKQNQAKNPTTPKKIKQKTPKQQRKKAEIPT